MTTPAQKRFKILIVENHPDTLASLTLYFEDLEHEVFTATTLEEARAELVKTAPDVLLCDIGLPDGKGWDLLSSVDLEKPLFAAAMSGFGMNADNARSREAGFRRHLVKPFKVAELDKLLEEAAAELNPERS